MATRSWNRVELIGNLTRDPELRYTPQGTAVITFSIATNRTYVTDGERKEEVDFHRIVAWNKLAELCSQLLKKGNRVFVSGRLQNRSWETQDGQNRQTTEIVIEDMILLTQKNPTGELAADESVPPPPTDPEKTPEPDLKIAEETPKAQASAPEGAKEEEGKEEKSKEQPKPNEEPGDLDDLPF